MARDRLQGLLATYPGDLEIRRRLGDAYWRLGNPTMAGRYWYLGESDAPEVAEAKSAFERSCGNNPQRMLQTLKFKGDPSAIQDPYARRTLQILMEGAEAQRPQLSDEQLARLRDWQRKSAITFYGCAGIAVLMILLFVIGFIFVLSKYV